MLVNGQERSCLFGNGLLKNVAVERVFALSSTVESLLVLRCMRDRSLWGRFAVPIAIKDVVTVEITCEGLHRFYVVEAAEHLNAPVG